MPFGGGIMQYGFQCGMIWGAALAAGAQAYRLLGPGPQAETKSIIAAQKLVESFRARNNNTNCLEITGVGKTSSFKKGMYYLVKGGPISCFRMVSKYASAALTDINTTLSEDHIEAPSSPVGCSAKLAKKLGASDMHTAMAAGFAGGIGLSGGGCGALGAAIWIMAMDYLKEGVGKLDYRFPKANDTIDIFSKCTGNEFECTKIVGRRFEIVHDHSAYLRDGGCSKIIEALATK